MKKFLWTLFVLLLVGVGFLVLIKNPQSNISQKILPMIGLENLVTEPITTIANPASVFCEQNSGTLEIITDPSGGQSGLCHLPDGNTCDEWAYMRGECPTSGMMDETIQTALEYSVKTEKGNNIPGENIYVYDVSGNKIFSLIADNDPDPQRLIKLIGKYLIVDYGTSFERTFRIYDILSNTKIFESNYHQGGNIREGLAVASNKINFDYTIWNGSYDEAGNPITRPNNAPICSSERNGYTEVRIFDLDTKQLTKSGTFNCAFYE